MRVAAVIPAHNEEQRLDAVLSTVIRLPFVDEIVVVDDGSTDKTAEVASGFSGVKVISLAANSGKGAAITAGARKTDADLLLFLDADLVGLNSDHVRSLIDPLLEDQDLAMTVGRFVSGRKSTNISQRLAPTLSGQRALRSDIFANIPDLEGTGYAFETILTDRLKKSSMPIKEVLLPNLTHVMKEEKIGYLRGFTNRLKMYWQIFYHLLKVRMSSIMNDPKPAIADDQNGLDAR